MRHESSEHTLDFDIEEIDPEFLQEVFQLVSAPKFLVSETTGKVTKIEKREVKVSKQVEETSSKIMKYGRLGESYHLAESQDCFILLICLFFSRLG